MSKSLVQQQFGANAANYVTSHVHAKGSSLGALVAAVDAQPTWAALDIATGGGHTALAIAPQVASVVASDLTQEMLDQVAIQVRERNLPNVSVALADAENLPFENHSFDLVTCRIAPHHFPNIPAFVGEAARVLRPGGRFGLVDNLSPDEETTPGFDADALAAADITYNEFERLRDPSHVRAWTATAWRECVTAQGLTVSDTQLSAKPMKFSAWCNNQSVSEDLVPTLRDMLINAEPAFQAFIQPHEAEGELMFVLAELILVADKPAA